MVRVMSVHHFAGQDIHTCEDPVAATTAPPDLLLLALPQHVIEVRDLTKESSIVSTFPTVDAVQRLVHCCTGNYVATLESKQSRQGKEVVYARIYANWDSVPNYDITVQPMRARIAGRVTPSSAQSGSGLEMIELPTKRTPNALACCQITGNLILASLRKLTLYHFLVRTHDISRLKFIDFEESPVSLEMSFVPWKLELCEDVIACMSKEYLHVLKVCDDVDDSLKERESKEYSNECPEKTVNNQAPLDWDEFIKTEKQKKDSKPSVLPTKMSEDVVSKKPSSAIIWLPGIVSEKSGNPFGYGSGGDISYRYSPFVTAPIEATIKASSATDWAVESKIQHLLQLHISSFSPSSGLQNIVTNDQFHCLLLKPIYTGEPGAPDNLPRNGHPMQSPFSKMLCGIVCLVTTHQEGYLYYFPVTSEGILVEQPACVTAYPFTAPVSCVVLEDYLLHALTDTGLETYTLRIGHFLPMYNADEPNVSPACTDPVCLVGLRPFLGVEYLLLSESYLLLLACSESSSSNNRDNWTLYSLQLPNSLTLYSDITAVGEVHKWTSRSTYCHLLGEAYLILHVALVALHWLPHSELARPVLRVGNRSHIEELYWESCALLGDYYILGSAEEDWEVAISYYKSSGLSPVQVVERVKAIQMPEEMASGLKENQVKGLMKYMKHCLLYMNWSENNENYTPAIPSFTNSLLDIFEEHDPDQVSWLILQSSLLREYATERVLNIMKKQLCTRLLPKLSDAVALVLLCIQKGSPEQATAVLQSLPEEQLSSILLANSSLLFETSSVTSNAGASTPGTWRNETVITFSELSVVVMDIKPIILADILASIVTSEKKISLQGILKVFMEHLSSRIGITGSTAGLVLQMFLEKFFSWYFMSPVTSSFDPPTVKALKILVRSYLSDLQRHDLRSTTQKNSVDNQTSNQCKNKVNSNQQNEQSTLFLDKRLPFLQNMPPFATNLSKKIISSQGGNKEVDSISRLENSQSTKSLIKLQALLCSGRLPKECLVEIYQFVQSHPQLYGNLSLQVLCLPAREGATVLMNFCPQVLLQFAKNKFVTEMEWKCLLLLLQKKIYALTDENVLKPLYVQIMKDCLSYLSVTMPLEDFCRILPSGTESSYQQYIHICQQVSQANHILTLIIATGQQLLTTLHL